MAWQYPTHSCGHAGERYQAYGPHSNRVRQLASIESQPCPSCRRVEATASSVAAGLHMLVGSDKQIAWAHEIRMRALRLLSDEEFERYRAEVSARWWIDHRDRFDS